MNRKLMALLLALSMLASILVGCASGAAQTSAPAETQTESAAQTAPETEQTQTETDEAATETEEASTPTDAETAVFTDSLGREVEIPANLTRVAPSGAVATMMLAVIAPEYMVTLSATPDEDQMEYLPQELASLPETGQMYGSKASLNLETLLSSDPQVIIDLGDKKGDMTEDLDALQEQVGIPVVFIEADLTHMADAFRTLGAVLSGKQERGEALAAFIDKTITMAEENSAKITDDTRRSVLYTSGGAGLDTNARGSIQAQVLDMVGAENAVVVEDVSNKGGGNTVSLEQLYNFDPDVIVFSPGSIYDTVAEDAAWQELTAIANGSYYEIPGKPYNWLSNPPSMNMLLGVWWLGNLVYPEVYDYDMADVAKEFYSLFWGYELTESDLTALLGNSTLRES